LSNSATSEGRGYVFILSYDGMWHVLPLLYGLCAARRTPSPACVAMPVSMNVRRIV